MGVLLDGEGEAEATDDQQGGDRDQQRAELVGGEHDRYAGWPGADVVTEHTAVVGLGYQPSAQAQDPRAGGERHRPGDGRAVGEQDQPGRRQ